MCVYCVYGVAAYVYTWGCVIIVCVYILCDSNMAGSISGVWYIQ